MYKKTATDELQDYIDQFEGRSPRSKHYTKRVSDLLSPKPKFKFVDAVERQLNEEMRKSGDGLLSWINSSYNESLKSTCVPLYVQETERTFPPLSLGELERRPNSHQGYQRVLEIDRGQHQDELSTLPSPRTSDVDIDSDQDTVETEVLLTSYHEQSKGSKKSAWVRNSASNSTYPKWVDEVNKSMDSEIDPRRLSSVSILLKSSNSKASLSQSRSMDTTGLTMDDASSIDTDVILGTSVYGKRPVNMGGNLHTPLFKDERVQAILNESRKKLKKNESKSLGRSVHGVSSLASSRLSQSIASPQRKDVIYSENILNKHRSLYNGSYDNEKINAKEYQREGTRQQRSLGSSRTQGSARTDISRSLRSQNKSHSSDASIRRSFVESSYTGKKNGISKLHLSVGTQATKETNHSLSPKRYPGKFASSSDFVTSSRETVVKNYPSKNSDLLDINSQRTSGYHSDILSPDYVPKDRKSELGKSVYLRRDPSPERLISSSRRIPSTENRPSMLRKDSDTTDVLMRQPPIGTKVHQRSKTWGYMQPFKSTLPEASSTPIRQPEYQAPSRYSASAAVRHGAVTSGSTASKIPPSSNPHSTINARTYVEKPNSYSGHREITRKNRLSDSAILSMPSSSSYTNWKSSALTSRRQDLVLREEEPEERDPRPNLEHVQQRYVANELELGEENVETSNRAVDSEFDDESLTQHNRTWPSIERLKEKSKMAYLRSKRNAANSPHLGWTAEKRSIPLRPQNSISIGSSTRIGSIVSPHLQSVSPHRSVSAGETRYRANVETSNRTKSSSLLLENSHFRQSNHQSKALQYVSDDDNATIDTDLLLSQPPMPVVDASPSLTTISDDDATIQGDNSNSDNQSFVDLPLRSSSRVSFAPDVSFSRTNDVSPLSKFESTNPRTADKHVLMNSVYKSLESSNHSRTFNRSSNVESQATRAELLDSFIEDCLHNSNMDIYRKSPVGSKTTTSNHSGQDEPRSVETLKNMLLNLSGIGPDDEKPANDDVTDEEESGNTSDDAASVVGEQSLARAYHHLERLKSLISGKVDS